MLSCRVKCKVHVKVYFSYWFFVWMPQMSSVIFGMNVALILFKKTLTCREQIKKTSQIVIYN